MASPSTATPKNADPAELRRALDTVDFFAGLIEAASLNRSKISARDPNIPVVIVTGFLGAGKTTLMRHLLTANHGIKIAAMVNDFAALNIDAALIADVADDTTALANGCICCSLTGGFARGLFEIAMRASPVDAILIEASGVSNPASIAHVVDTVDGVTLDCIVAVVDAAESSQSQDWDAFIDAQVSSASIVLLNKTDVVPDKVADKTCERLAVLAPRAQILRTVNCAVPPLVIFDGASTPIVEHVTNVSEQEHQFQTWVLTAPNAVDRALLEDTLDRLPEGIVRIKGFLRLSNAPQSTLLLQCVGRHWSLHAAPESSRLSKLVVIGQSNVVSENVIMDHFKPLGLEPDVQN